MGICADKPMPNERTTSEVARDIGVAPDVIRKWKYRGLLKLAPQGVSGQGRSVECMWSKEAFEEAKAHAENPNIINRHRNPPDSPADREGK